MPDIWCLDVRFAGRRRDEETLKALPVQLEEARPCTHRRPALHG